MQRLSLNLINIQAFRLGIVQNHTRFLLSWARIHDDSKLLLELCKLLNQLCTVFDRVQLLEELRGV
jgi:hypothetical protein